MKKIVTLSGEEVKAVSGGDGTLTTSGGKQEDIGRGGTLTTSGG